jgi:hypothetical protein
VWFCRVPDERFDGSAVEFSVRANYDAWIVQIVGSAGDVPWLGSRSFSTGSDTTSQRPPSQALRSLP